MALNETLYDRLRDAGFSHQASVVLILRMVSRNTAGGGVKTLYANTSLPLHFWAINLGQP